MERLFGSNSNSGVTKSTGSPSLEMGVEPSEANDKDIPELVETYAQETHHLPSPGQVNAESYNVAYREPLILQANTNGPDVSVRLKTDPFQGVQLADSPTANENALIMGDSSKLASVRQVVPSDQLKGFQIMRSNRRVILRGGDENFPSSAQVDYISFPNQEDPPDSHFKESNLAQALTIERVKSTANTRPHDSNTHKPKTDMSKIRPARLMVTLKLPKSAWIRQNVTKRQGKSSAAPTHLLGCLLPKNRLPSKEGKSKNTKPKKSSNPTAKTTANHSSSARSLNHSKANSRAALQTSISLWTAEEDFDLLEVDTEMLSLSRKLTAHIKMTPDQKPDPQGEPLVWADSRQALCETVPYFKKPQGGCHHNDRHVYAFLFDGVGHCREYMDSDVIIARAGGSMESDGNGTMIQAKHQAMSDAQVQAVMNDLELQNPLIVICGDRNTGSPSKMPHKYCVLGWYKPVLVWAEKTAGKGKKSWTTVKYRFERLRSEEPAWHAPKNTNGRHQGPVSPVRKNACGSCHKSSPQIYLLSWLCLNPDCEFFWKLASGIDAHCGALDYDPLFLLERNPWPVEEEPFNVKPPLPDIGNAIGDNLSYVNTRGICCPECGRCNPRYLFKGWRCDNPKCSWEWYPEHRPILHSALHQPWDTFGDGPSLGRNKHETGVKLEVSYVKGYKVYKYTFDGIDGSFIHAVANRKINREHRAADEMLIAMQTEDMSFQRRRFGTEKMSGSKVDKALPKTPQRPIGFYQLPTPDENLQRSPQNPLNAECTGISQQSTPENRNLTASEHVIPLSPYQWRDAASRIPLLDVADPMLGMRKQTILTPPNKDLRETEIPGYAEDTENRTPTENILIQKATHNPRPTMSTATAAVKTIVVEHNAPPIAIDSEALTQQALDADPSDAILTALIKSAASETEHSPKGSGDGTSEAIQQTKESEMEAGDFMTAFSMNYGMPYKFVTSGASLPFEEAPWPVTECRSRLNWAARTFLDNRTLDADFNEELIFAYMEGQKIEYHDDGEEGLGPRIATLSLGGKAKMHMRMKMKHYTGCSRTGLFTPERPVPGGIGGKDMDERRLAEWEKLQAHKAVDRAAYQARLKQIPRELGLFEKRTKKADDLVTVSLSHGDIILMEGYDIQKYLEHKVVPEGYLRFALTCRTVLANHLKPEELPDYEVRPDNHSYQGPKD